MKKIFTLCAFACFTLIPAASKAQFSENFEGSYTSLTGNCFQFIDMGHTSDGQFPSIAGLGSMYNLFPLTSVPAAEIATPYLNINSLSLTLTVSFKYKIINGINGQSIKTIDIGLRNSSGVFTLLHTITLDKNSPTTVQNFNMSFFPVAISVQRLVIRLGGNNGDGNCRLMIDDLSASAGAHYGPTTNCNSAPTAVDDAFNVTSFANVLGNVLTNDTEPNGETVTPSIVSSSPGGVVTLNPNGSFLFVPNPLFGGNTTTFTYRNTDNGYDPDTSNTATVTFTFLQGGTLAVKLLNFQGTRDENKISLQWVIGENETTERFEVERSMDGKNFSTATLVLSSEKAGTENYQFAENIAASKVYYRLRMMDKSGVVNYSRILVLSAKSDASNEIKIIGNPVTDKLTFSFQSAGNAMTDIKVTDLAGRPVQQQKIATYKGNNTISISLPATCTSGMYIIELFDGVNHATGKFIKQ